MHPKIRNSITQIRFEINRLLSPLLIFSIIPTILLLYFLLYLYYISSGSVSMPSEKYDHFLISTRIFSFILHFIISLYSISLGVYTLYDLALVFIICSTGDRVEPYFTRFISVQLVIMVLVLLYILLFSLFSILFYIVPPIEILFVLILTSFINTLCYTSVTFLSYALVKSIGLEPLYSLILPICIFFIIPQFIYGGVSSGLFPIFLYELTFQYHLSAITNFLLPSPFLSSTSLDIVLFSSLLLLLSIFFSFIVFLLLSKNFEYL